MPHLDIPMEYLRLTRYPHMSPADIDLWDRFIERNPARFSRVWYDVHVGEGGETPEDCGYRDAACWWDLTRWRIDVVAEDGENFYIIEIKPNANAKALGQANAYAILFEDEHKPLKPVVSVVLTDSIHPNTERIAKREEIEIWKI